MVRPGRQVPPRHGELGVFGHIVAGWVRSLWRGAGGWLGLAWQAWEKGNYKMIDDNEYQQHKLGSITALYWLLAMLVGAVAVATVRQLAIWWFA